MNQEGKYTLQRKILEAEKFSVKENTEHYSTG